LENTAMPNAATAAPDPGQPDSLLVTVKEAAALLRVSEDTLDRLAAYGKLRKVRIGRSVRYRRSDVEAFALGLEG
jgi:excisionase family DNA binding protein